MHKKRWMAFALSVVMAVSAFSTTSFAQSAAPGEISSELTMIEETQEESLNAEILSGGGRTALR